MRLFMVTMAFVVGVSGTVSAGDERRPAFCVSLRYTIEKTIENSLMFDDTQMKNMRKNSKVVKDGKKLDTAKVMKIFEELNEWNEQLLKNIERRLNIYHGLKCSEYPGNNW